MAITLRGSKATDSGGRETGLALPLNSWGRRSRTPPAIVRCVAINILLRFTLSAIHSRHLSVLIALSDPYVQNVCMCTQMRPSTFRLSSSHVFGEGPPRRRNITLLSLPLNIPTALGGEAGKRDASILLQVSWMHLSSSAFFGQKLISATSRLLGQENLGKACMHSDSNTCSHRSPLLSSHLRPKGKMSILFCLKDLATASGPSAASVLWSERRRRPTCPESKLATLDI